MGCSRTTSLAAATRDRRRGGTRRSAGPRCAPSAGSTGARLDRLRRAGRGAIAGVCRGVRSRVRAAGRAAVLRQLTADLTYARNRPPGSGEAIQLVLHATNADADRLSDAATRARALGDTLRSAAWASAAQIDRDARSVRLRALAQATPAPAPDLALRLRIAPAWPLRSPIRTRSADATTGTRSPVRRLRRPTGSACTTRATGAHGIDRPHAHARRAACDRRHDGSTPACHGAVVGRHRTALPHTAASAVPPMRLGHAVSQRRRLLPRAPWFARARRMHFFTRTIMAPLPGRMPRARRGEEPRPRDDKCCVLLWVPDRTPAFARLRCVAASARQAGDASGKQSYLACALSQATTASASRGVMSG